MAGSPTAQLRDDLLIASDTLLGCGAASEVSDVSLLAERETIGDTTFLRIISESVCVKGI